MSLAVGEDEGGREDVDDDDGEEEEASAAGRVGGYITVLYHDDGCDDATAEGKEVTTGDGDGDGEEERGKLLAVMVFKSISLQNKPNPSSLPSSLDHDDMRTIPLGERSSADRSFVDWSTVSVPDGVFFDMLRVRGKADSIFCLPLILEKEFSSVAFDSECRLSVEYIMRKQKQILHELQSRRCGSLRVKMCIEAWLGCDMFAGALFVSL